MSALLIWIGYAAIAVGILLLSPLRDILPVNLIPLIQKIFHCEQGNTYFRLVPTDGRVDPLIWIGLSVAAIGLGLVALGYFIKPGQ